MSANENVNTGSDATRPKGRLLVVGAGIAVAVALAAAFGFVVLRPKAPRAIQDIRNADAALSKLMADTGVENVYELFYETGSLFGKSVPETLQKQSDACLKLLCNGKNAYLNLRAEMRNLLVSSYMYLGPDPWGHAYQFYLGPLKCPVNEIPFRSYRGSSYVYDKAAYQEAEKVKKGNPAPEAGAAAAGFPAPANKPFYIFSNGENGKPDQLPWKGNGGDDINNWDADSGWEKAK